MNVRIILSLFALASVCLCSQTSAQTYRIGYDSTSYSVQEGGTVDVTVILTEEISGGETARLDPTDDTDDLFAFALSTDYSVFSGAASGSIHNMTELNPGFDPGFSTISDSGTVVSFEGAVNVSDPGLTGTMVSATEYQLELATLTFNAGDLNSLTTLQLGPSELLTGNPDLLFLDGSTPTVSTFGFAQIVVVPEPGSLAVIALFSTVGLLKRRRS